MQRTLAHESDRSAWLFPKPPARRPSSFVSNTKHLAHTKRPGAQEPAAPLRPRTSLHLAFFPHSTHGALCRTPPAPSAPKSFFQQRLHRSLFPSHSPHHSRSAANTHRLASLPPHAPTPLSASSAAPRAQQPR